MIIAADATTYANKALEMIGTEVEAHKEALRLGAGIVDFPAYRFEVGYLAGLTTAIACMADAARDLSDPQSKQETP